MQRRVLHSLLGLSLLGALLAVPQAAVGAQGGWTGFEVLTAPSQITSAEQPVLDSPGWGVAVTEDIGGAGVDVWNNNHFNESEALIDYTGGPAVFANAFGAPPDSDSHGAVFSDIDGDGDDDFFETAGRDNDNLIFINNAGVLSLNTSATGIKDNEGRGRQPLMVDIDNDGDMDAFVANLDRSVIPDPENEGQFLAAAPSELYLNDGTGLNWTKVADPGGVIDDGNIRMFHLTSTGPGTNNVVIASSAFSFAGDSIATGSATLADPPQSVRSIMFGANGATRIRDIALGDVDGDLIPDAIVARQDDRLNTDDDEDMTPDWLGQLPLTKTTVTVNPLVSPTLDPISTNALADNCRSIALADYDNDADLDIFGACTFLEAGQDRNIILLNDGSGNFSIGDVSLLPATADNTATAVAAVDIDKDGWMDTFVVNGYDDQNGDDHIFRNKGGNGNHWLQIELDGSNADSMGAQVFVGTTKWQVRETGHRAHVVQDTGVLHFGLGTETALAPIYVKWNNGDVEECTAPASVDTRVTITKGGADCTAISTIDLVRATSGTPSTSTTTTTTIPQGPMCRARVATVDLSKGETPTEGPDVILGTDGDDVIDGLGGDDFICGGLGNDVIMGGPGKDRIFGDAGADIIDGGLDRDVIQGGAGNDHLTGGKSNDRISGNAGKDKIFGSNGRDILTGNSGADTITGGGGNDRMQGSSGDDVGFGKIGDDFCAGFVVQTSCEFDL